jgi:lipoprotein
MKTTITRNVIAILGILLPLLSFSSCTDKEEVDVSYNTQIKIDLSEIVKPYTYQLHENELNTLPDHSKLEVALMMYNRSTGELAYQNIKSYPSYSTIANFNLNVSTVGTYQAIVITRVVSDEGVSYWDISGIDNLNTLRIRPNYESSDFGMSQIIGIGTIPIWPSGIRVIPVKAAGALLIPRVKCHTDLTTNHTSVKLTISNCNGEYVFDEKGNYSFTNIKEESTCVMEFDPRIFYHHPQYSYHTLYTYKFIPDGCILKVKMECIGTREEFSKTELFDRDDSQVTQGNEYVLKLEIGPYYIMSAFGDATGKNYIEEKKAGDDVFGVYTNDYGTSLSTIDTHIGRFGNHTYIIEE